MSGEDTVTLRRLEVFHKYAREDRAKAEEAAARARQTEARTAMELLHHVNKMKQEKKL